MTKLALSAVSFAAILACAPGGIGGETSETGTETGGDGDGDPAGDVWAEIECKEMAPGIQAYFGRPSAAEDSWHLVISDEVISEAINGTMIWTSRSTGDWGRDSCAFEQAADTHFPVEICVDDSILSVSSCLAGGGGWFTRLAPACAATIGPEPAWSEEFCGGEAGFVGQHPWDAITCTAGAMPHCVARDNDSTAVAFPTCWVESLPDCGGGSTGDGDGDMACDFLGCPCEAGGCVENLVCTLSEACSPCPPGSPGCPCGADDYCEAGTCSSGIDGDGTAWSICYPADLIGCDESNPCPGDAYCTDDGKCAWS